MILLILGVVALVTIVLSLIWRVVVPTDHVHIVQRRTNSTTYGQNSSAGNVYYAIPSSIPFFGVRISKFTTAIFPIVLQGYDAYDSNRVPFVVDVLAYCRVSDAVVASQRISDFADMEAQLQGTMRGAVRRVLAGSPINEIMTSRATLRDEFQKEVSEQMSNWGVLLTSIEFMNLSDFPGTKVITNIMDKERTTIEMESRTKVASNMQAAELAEITARQTVDLRSVEKNRVVSLESQRAAQTVNEEAAKTKLSEAVVSRVQVVQAQEIEKNRQEVEADTQAEVAKREASGRAAAMKTDAQGYSDARTLEAEGDSAKVRAVGTAEADVIKAKGFSEADAKLKMAEALKSYNDAGLSIEKLKTMLAVETAKYTALGAGLSTADVKIVQSGEGKSLFGIPLNAESGATIDTFLKQLGIGSLGEAAEMLKNAVISKKA